MGGVLVSCCGSGCSCCSGVVTVLTVLPFTCPNVLPAPFVVKAYPRVPTIRKEAYRAKVALSLSPIMMVICDLRVCCQLLSANKISRSEMCLELGVWGNR